MNDHRGSFRKTVVGSCTLVAIGAAALVAAAGLDWARLDAWSPAVAVGTAAAMLLAGIMTMFFAMVAVGGLIALRRDALEAEGKPYAVSMRRECMSGLVFAKWWSNLARRLARSGRSRGVLGLRPGELVEIRSLDEILGSLDENGTLDGVPFMPEMAVYCGRRARVFRRIDKLHDWVHGTGLRRMRNLVLLDDLRCDGSAHGGCQAACHLRWREAWLRRVRSGGPPYAPAERVPLRPAGLERLKTRRDEARFVCQATELTAGGEHLAWWDPRHYARDLFTCNVRFRPFLVGIALACFNWVQRHRSAVAFPFYTTGRSKSSPQEVLGLEAGELVRVKAKRSIELTLNNRSRNRGLWFDREMLRYCGGEYTVRRRVERVIVERTGELRLLTNPCIVLEGVASTGEYLGFNPENEYIFWREIWLERIIPIPMPVAQSRSQPKRTLKR